MFRIGQFSRFSRVTVKMLRHYDELGLLSPAWVDPHSSYRYYTADQLPRLQRLIALKDLGFRLDQIGALLDESLTTEQLAGLLKARRAELTTQMQQTAVQLAQLDARLQQLQHPPNSPTYDVLLRAVESQMMATIQQAVHQPGDVTALFEELESYVSQFHARAPHPPLLLYHDAEYLEQGENVEVLVPVQKPLPTNGRIAIRQLPAQPQMACLIHTGAYSTLPQALATLLSWIEQNQHHIIGPTRELFLRFGAAQHSYSLPPAYLATSASQFVTELQIPVAPQTTMNKPTNKGQPATR